MGGCSRFNYFISKFSRNDDRLFQFMRETRNCASFQESLRKVCSCKCHVVSNEVGTVVVRLKFMRPVQQHIHMTLLHNNSVWRNVYGIAVKRRLSRFQIYQTFDFSLVNSLIILCPLTNYFAVLDSLWYTRFFYI